VMPSSRVRGRVLASKRSRKDTPAACPALACARAPVRQRWLRDEEHQRL
jgi:hypothetical protein